MVSPSLRAAVLLVLPACTAAAGPLPSRCEAIAVDPSRELMVTDAKVLSSGRFGFARVMGTVLGPGDGTVLGPGVEQAQFELIAIANRVDFATLGSDHAGELRFVYGLVAAGGGREPVTLNVEIHLPDRQTPQAWAADWHALGALTGDAYQAGLEALVNSVLAVAPKGQIRMQDARHMPPTLVEFDFHPCAPLARAPLQNQPAPGTNARDLAAFVVANQQDVMAGAEVLPTYMLAWVTPPAPIDMSLPGVSSDLAKAFADTTCSGCHSSQPTLDGAFHVSPLRRGSGALSEFLTGSSASAGELARRAEVLRGLVCN